MSNSESDSVTGFDRAPTRYTGKGRETIDRIRDALGDESFTAWCIGNVIKYSDRKGLKGDPKEDRQKELFYRQMALHVMGKAIDPRSDRPGFEPYQKRDFGDLDLIRFMHLR